MFVAAGCASKPTAPAPAERGHGAHDHGGAHQPASFAGTWSREGGGERSFVVTDDGQLVRGTLADGSGPEFRSYTFELRRRGDELKGRARFELADVPGRTYETAWDAHAHGASIHVTAELLLLVPETNDVVGREREEWMYALGPAPLPRNSEAPPPDDEAAQLRADAEAAVPSDGPRPVIRASDHVDAHVDHDHDHDHGEHDEHDEHEPER